MSGKKKTTEVITTETEVTLSKSVCFILLSKCVCVWWCFSDVVCGDNDDVVPDRTSPNYNDYLST